MKLDWSTEETVRHRKELRVYHGADRYEGATLSDLAEWFAAQTEEDKRRILVALCGSGWQQSRAEALVKERLEQYESPLKERLADYVRELSRVRKALGDLHESMGAGWGQSR